MGSFTPAGISIYNKLAHVLVFFLSGSATLNETRFRIMYRWCRVNTGKPLAKGCSAVVYAAKLQQTPEDAVGGDRARAGQRPEEEFPFAIKMMFNYHAESNAFTILRAMQR